MTLAPGAHAVLYATIKVSSTETGVIYGYVAYDMKSADDKVGASRTCFESLYGYASGIFGLERATRRYSGLH